MSVATTLADAVVAALLVAFPANSTNPVIARRWRVDLAAEDVPSKGLLFVTLGESSRERVSRSRWHRAITINVVSVDPIDIDSKTGPSNADAFDARHEAIGAVLESMPEAARNVSAIEENLPMQGQTNDGVPILSSTFSVTFK